MEWRVLQLDGGVERRWCSLWTRSFNAETPHRDHSNSERSELPILQSAAQNDLHFGRHKPIVLEPTRIVLKETDVVHHRRYHIKANLRAVWRPHPTRHKLSSFSCIDLLHSFNHCIITGKSFLSQTTFLHPFGHSNFTQSPRPPPIFNVTWRPVDSFLLPYSQAKPVAYQYYVHDHHSSKIHCPLRAVIVPSPTFDTFLFLGFHDASKRTRYCRSSFDCCSGHRCA